MSESSAEDPGARGGFELRRATEADLPEVGRISVEAYVGGGFVPAGDDYAGRLGDATVRLREGELWVAVDPDGTVLGTVTFCAAGTALREIAHDDEGEFRMLGVADAARRRGVGQALVELCVRRSRVLGYAGVRMSSMPQMSASHRVYARLGFVRSPADDWSPTPGVQLLGFVLRF